MIVDGIRRCRVTSSCRDSWILFLFILERNRPAGHGHGPADEQVPACRAAPSHPAAVELPAPCWDHGDPHEDPKDRLTTIHRPATCSARPAPHAGIIAAHSGRHRWAGIGPGWFCSASMSPGIVGAPLAAIGSCGRPSKCHDGAPLISAATTHRRSSPVASVRSFLPPEAR